jgi:predicted esterase
MQEHHVTVARSARYHTLGNERGVEQLWIVCHGYAQLAARFLRHFAPLDDGTRLIVAPEALNRFYIEAGPGRHGPDSKVGATWMTREDRLAEIADYVRYLDALCDTILARLDRGALTITALGFSQGAATVARWAVQGRNRPNHLILWASPLPPEIDIGAGAEELARLERVSMVVGARDDAAQQALPAERDRLARLGLQYVLHTFDGGHHLDVETLRALAK